MQQKKQQQQQSSLKDLLLHPRIAVIVQEQLFSAVSGVAFSINPSNNCYDEIMISPNFGLGESVVSGTVTPDVYVVENKGIRNKKTDGDDGFVDDDKNFAILEKRIGDKRESTWLFSQQHDQMSNTEKSNSEVGTSLSGTKQSINQDPTRQALSDEQILQVASLVAQVETAYQHVNPSVFSSCKRYSSYALLPPQPVDIEWAYDERDGTLYLLQARPVTSYIPLFPEMLTPRGAKKKNLYLDVIVMTQGFSEPLSVLGLDIWKYMLGLVKPQFSSDGPEGLSWNLHGRYVVEMFGLCSIVQLSPYSYGAYHSLEIQ
jgi:pyruvate,water dikinase